MFGFDAAGGNNTAGTGVTVSALRFPLDTIWIAMVHASFSLRPETSLKSTHFLARFRTTVDQR